MATSNMVPMLDPQGNPGFVPQENVSEAVKSGGKVGFHVQAPDGTLGIVPAEKLHDAINAGGKLYQHPQDTTQFENERNPANQPGLLHSAASELGNVAMGAVGAVGSLANPTAAIAQAGQAATDDTARKLAGRSGAYRVAAGVGSALGVNARGMEDAAEVGNTRGVLGTALADAGVAAGAPKLGEKLKAMSEARTEAKVVNPPAAAKKLADAFNINAKEMPHFEEHMEKHIGRVETAAEQHGIDLKRGGRAAVVDALRKGAADHQEVYDKQLLEPIKDKRMIVDPESGRRGSMTYADAEGRLRHLNDLINYDEGLKAEGETQLARKAEANGLRKSLNEGIAKDLGVTPEQVAEARSAGEQMRAMANQGQLTMNLERNARNAQERGGSANIHATPKGAYATSGGRLSAKINRGVDAVFGHPGDNAVGEVFNNLRAPKPNMAVPNAPKPTPTPARRVPDWQRAGQGEPAGNYAYRVRDVGEEGIPLRNSHAQATTSADEAGRYVESRGSVQGKPQELVRVNLDKLGKGDYELVKGPNGSKWVRFAKEVPESAIERGGNSGGGKGGTATISENMEASRRFQEQRAAERQQAATQRAETKAKADRLSGAVNRANIASHGKFKRTEKAAADGLGGQ